jgi:hypothetical protein
LQRTTLTQTLAEKLRQNKVNNINAEALAASERAAAARLKHEAAVVYFFADVKTFILESVEAGKSDDSLNIRLGSGAKKAYPDLVNHYPDVVSAFHLTDDESPDVSAAKSEYASHWTSFLAWADENGLEASFWRECRGHGQYIDARWFELQVRVKREA